MSLIERAVNQQLRSAPGSQPVCGPADAIAPISAETTAQAPESIAITAPAEQPQGGLPGDAPPATPHIEIRISHLRERGFVLPNGQASRTAEEFRVIKRPLIANAFGTSAAPVRHGKRVMVSSAFSGEGKSFCAINLALSIAAERDHQVLLVDADVARPSIPTELGFKGGAGLMDLVLEPMRHPIESVVLQTDVDKLAVLPAGRRHEHATELLASQGMSDLLDRLTARFPDRILIFDSPPLLVTTESRVLATHMGQIVLVVEASRTPRAAVTEAIGTIEGAAEVVAMILNKATGTHTGGYGYYGYGNAYGYGHERKPSTAA